MSTTAGSKIIEKKTALVAVAAHTIFVCILALFGNEWAPFGVLAVDLPLSLILVPLAKLAHQVNVAYGAREALFWAPFLVFGAIWQYVLWKYLGRLGYWLYNR